MICGVAAKFGHWTGARVAAISTVISEHERNAANDQMVRNLLGDNYFSQLRCWLSSLSPEALTKGDQSGDGWFSFPLEPPYGLPAAVVSRQSHVARLSCLAALDLAKIVSRATHHSFSEAPSQVILGI